MSASNQPSGQSSRTPEEFDDWAGARLRALPPPADLRASLRLERMAQPETHLNLRRLAVLIGSAAALVLAIVYVMDEYTDRRDFHREADFRSAMAAYVAEVEFKLDYRSDNLDALLQYFGRAQPLQLEEIPASLRARIPKGCKEIAWGKHSVSLICFHEHKPGGRLVHLFMIDKSDVPAAEIVSLRQTLRRFGLETTGWDTPRHACMLVAGDSDLVLTNVLTEPSSRTPVHGGDTGV